METAMIYAWLVVLLVCIVLEAATPALLTIWLIPAAFIAFILACLPISVPVWLQITVFVAGSFLCVFLSKTIFKKCLSKAPFVATNLDAVIGKTAVVTEDSDGIEGVGAAKIEGKVWSCVSVDGEKLKKGELVEIVEIRGVKLVCKKIKNNETKE